MQVHDPGKPFDHRGATPGLGSSEMCEHCCAEYLQEGGATFPVMGPCRGREGALKWPTENANKRPRRQQKVNKGAARGRGAGAQSFPRHALRKALRIPKAVLEQNAGRPCTDREALKFAGVGYNGPSRVELSSAIKYGFLDRPTEGNVSVTDLGKKVLRPQTSQDELDGVRQALLNAPLI